MMLVLFVSVTLLSSCAFSGIPVEKDEFVLRVEHHVAGINDVARFSAKGYSTDEILTSGIITLTCPCYDLDNNGKGNLDHLAKSIQIGGEGDVIPLQLLAPLAKNDYYGIVVYLNSTQVDSFSIYFWGKRDDPQPNTHQQ